MLEINKIEAGALAQNCRLLVDSETRDALMVDPGGEADALVSLVREVDCNLNSVVLTHSHFDHTGGVKGVMEALKPPGGLLASKIEKEMRVLTPQVAAGYGLPPVELFDEPEVCLSELDKLSLGGLQADVLFTPGHSPGHFCFFFPETEILRKQYEVRGDKVSELKSTSDTQKAPVLIAGDLVFAGSVGRTDLPGGSMPVLLESIAKQVLPLPEETLLLPGHGPDTTVGTEKRENPFLQGLS